MGPHPSLAEPSGAHPGYETWLVRSERRVVQVSAEVPRRAYVFWEAPDVVRLVERDPGGAITFLHEVRLEPAFLATGLARPFARGLV